MTKSAQPAPPIGQRLRIRFRKDNTLRWISHHDLMRVLERLVRRARLQPVLSHGFHPKPKIRLASALTLGAEGWNEVAEIDLVDSADADLVREQLAAQCPTGLTILSVRALPPGTAKAQVAATCYALDLPAERRAAVDEALRQLRTRPTLTVQRHDEPEPVEVPVHLDALDRQGDTLHLKIPAGRGRSARPRELLAALGLDDLLQHGYCLRRTSVELVP